MLLLGVLSFEDVTIEQKRDEQMAGHWGHDASGRSAAAPHRRAFFHFSNEACAGAMPLALAALVRRACNEETGVSVAC